MSKIIWSSFYRCVIYLEAWEENGVVEGLSELVVEPGLKLRTVSGMTFIACRENMTLF